MAPASSILEGPIRPDSELVHIYSEGNIALLYDADHQEHIADAEPSVLEDEDSADDDATQDLVRDGLLLVYATEDDSGIDAEVLVGQPLTPEELALGCWQPPQQGYLQLPTGRLQIHSHSTLPIGPNADEDMDEEGYLLETTAGEYIVTIYRKDWARMEEKGLVEEDWQDEDNRTNDIIVLTPDDEGELEGTPPIILFEEE